MFTSFWMLQTNPYIEANYPRNKWALSIRWLPRVYCTAIISLSSFNFCEDIVKNWNVSQKGIKMAWDRQEKSCSVLEVYFNHKHIHLKIISTEVVVNAASQIGHHWQHLWLEALREEGRSTTFSQGFSSSLPSQAPFYLMTSAWLTPNTALI